VTIAGRIIFLNNFCCLDGGALSKESSPWKAEHKTEAPQPNNQNSNVFQQLPYPFPSWFSAQPLPQIVNVITSKDASKISECPQPEHWKEWPGFWWCRILEGAVSICVGIDVGAIYSGTRLPDYAARSIV
jgi:hypothetical protein